MEIYLSLTISDEMHTCKGWCLVAYVAFIIQISMALIKYKYYHPSVNKLFFFIYKNKGIFISLPMINKEQYHNVDIYSQLSVGFWQILVTSSFFR